MAQSTTHSRSRPRRVRRVRYVYESESEIDFDPRNSSRSERPTRSARQVQTYREDSSDNSAVSGIESSSEDDEQIQLEPPSRTRIPYAASTSSAASVRKRKTRPSRSSAHKSSFDSFKRRKITQQNSQVKSAGTNSSLFEIPQTGNIPPWQELPYQILQSIMQYATYPLYEKASRSTPSIEWICGVSMLCKSFHEACMAALLYSPPLYPSYRAHGLLTLLKRQRITPMTNYHSKIKCLDVEVKNLLIRKSGIDLEELLNYTPLLERLRLYHNHDDFGTAIWAQPSASKDRWAYPQHLFDHLEDRGIVLKSFEWNGRFPRPMEVLQNMLECHSRRPFQHLSELTIVNLLIPERDLALDLTTANTLLTSALEKLPELRSLSIRNCNIIDELTLPLFPHGLHELEISNCLSLNSSALEQFLSQKGTKLRKLAVKGNQAMSLGFLADLKESCPNLQILDIDLTYTDPTSYRDRDPLYDELLPNGTPTWPSTLVSISIENLRQLSADEAEGFFDSLVSAAGSLPYLRVLIIKAILKEASWRDRAEMRQKWMPKFLHVFLNTSSPEVRKTPLKRPQPSQPPLPSSSRQSTRIANSHLKKLNLADSSEDSEANSPRSNPEDSTLIRQGRCDIVELILSDQRPAQEQYHENDFLDDEPSGDEEWTGRNEESNTYAW